MAINSAFQPLGKSVCIQSSTANTQSNVFTITADSPAQQYLITNHDVNSSVNVRISSTNDFNIAIPSEVGAYGICIPPYGFKVFGGPQVNPSANVFARIISDGANIKCTICPGEGV
jgi:hypothetical protein